PPLPGAAAAGLAQRLPPQQQRQCHEPASRPPDRHRNRGAGGLSVAAIANATSNALNHTQPRSLCMKRVLLASILAAAFALPASAALKEGDAAPAFKAQASQAGKAFAFSLRDALKKGPVVVYFYPSAFTGGCN